MPTCKSCGAEITWIETPKGVRIPVDPMPVHITSDALGDTIIIMKDGKTLRGNRIVDNGTLTGFLYLRAKYGHTPHFTTCPHAKGHRKDGEA